MFAGTLARRDTRPPRCFFFSEICVIFLIVSITLVLTLRISWVQSEIVIGINFWGVKGIRLSPPSFTEPSVPPFKDYTYTLELFRTNIPKLH